jgi:hypothetical protein
MLLLAGTCAAQDTNFPVGPQYLITSNSPLFLRPIATPTLSLGTPLPSGPAVSTEASSTTEPVSAAAGTLNQPDLTRIYWRGPTASESSSVIEITSAEPPRALPASIIDVGVARLADPQSLRERGYGATLGETASFWKTHKAHATRVFTNRDIERLHGG